MSLGDWKFNCFLVLLFSKLYPRSKKRCVKFSEFWSALMISWQDLYCGSLNWNTFGYYCTLHHWFNILQFEIGMHWNSHVMTIHMWFLVKKDLCSHYFTCLFHLRVKNILSFIFIHSNTQYIIFWSRKMIKALNDHTRWST